MLTGSIAAEALRFVFSYMGASKPGPKESLVLPAQPWVLASQHLPERMGLLLIDDGETTSPSAANEPFCGNEPRQT